jgi:hypothetical protein
MENKKIESRMIFEIIGKPKEHVEETFKDFISKLSQQEGIEVTNKTVHEPKSFENKDKEGKPVKTDLFSSFAEVEMKTKDIVDLLSVIFRFMPSHIEIIYPEELTHSNLDFNMMLNNVIGRLHHYDSVAKAAIFQNQVLARKFEELTNNQPQSIPVNVEIIEPKIEEKPAEEKEAKKNKPKKEKKKA